METREKTHGTPSVGNRRCSRVVQSAFSSSSWPRSQGLFWIGTGSHNKLSELTSSETLSPPFLLLDLIQIYLWIYDVSGGIDHEVLLDDGSFPIFEPAESRAMIRSTTNFRSQFQPSMIESTCCLHLGVTSPKRD